MKKSIVLVCILGMVSAVFAAEKGSKRPMYAKAEVGFYDGGTIISTDYNGLLSSKVDQVFVISGFEITPTFGIILPFTTEKEFGTLKTSVEAQIPMVFGSAVSAVSGLRGDSSATVISPGILLIESYYFPESNSKLLQKLSGQMGIGFSVPISTVKGTYSMPKTTYPYGTVEESFSETGIGFKLNFIIGTQFNITDSIAINFDENIGFIGEFSYSTRFGATWYF
nr:hypothetical protein [uncultured Treponema sp.]